MLKKQRNWKTPPLWINKNSKFFFTLLWLNLTYVKNKKYTERFTSKCCFVQVLPPFLFTWCLTLFDLKGTLEYFLQCQESGHNLLTVLFLPLMSRQICFWSIFPRPFFAGDVDILNSMVIFCHLSHLLMAEERRWEWKPNIRGERD